MLASRKLFTNFTVVRDIALLKLKGDV